MPVGADPQELTPRFLALSDAARELLLSFAERVELGQAVDGAYEAIRPVASKAAEQSARIAVVLTLWADRQATEVAAETMQDALALTDFYLTEALRLAQKGSIDVEIAQAERIRVWILTNCPSGYVTRRQIQNGGPNALRNAKIIKSAIRILVEHGWLRLAEPGTLIDGRVTQEAYRVVRG